MPKLQISFDHKRNFRELKDSAKEDAEALIIAYDKEKEEQVLLIGTIFEGDTGENEFVPHAEIINLDEVKAKDRYIYHTSEEEFQKAID